MLFAFEVFFSVPLSGGRDHVVRIYIGPGVKSFLTSKLGSLIEAFVVLLLCFDVVLGLCLLMIRCDHV